MAAPVLDRRLGTFDAASIILSNVIGSGIFLTPAIVASLTGGGWMMVAVWAAGGLIAFAGATAMDAALRPHAGGGKYLRAAFGPVAGFLSGWTSFIAGFSSAVAASAVGFASYLGHFSIAATSGPRDSPARHRHAQADAAVVDCDAADRPAVAHITCGLGPRPCCRCPRRREGDWHRSRARRAGLLGR